MHNIRSFFLILYYINNVKKSKTLSSDLYKFMYYKYKKIYIIFSLKHK